MATGILGSAVPADDDTETLVDQRVCQEDGCSTVLSRYNGTAWCGLHSRRDWRANREPRRRSTT